MKPSAPPLFCVPVCVISIILGPLQNPKQRLKASESFYKIQSIGWMDWIGPRGKRLEIAPSPLFSKKCLGFCRVTLLPLVRANVLSCMRKTMFPNTARSVDRSRKAPLMAWSLEGQTRHPSFAPPVSLPTPRIISFPSRINEFSLALPLAFITTGASLFFEQFFLAFSWYTRIPSKRI